MAFVGYAIRPTTCCHTARRSPTLEWHARLQERLAALRRILLPTVLLLLVAPSLPAQQGLSPFITVRILSRASHEQITTSRVFWRDGTPTGTIGEGGEHAIPRPVAPQVLRVAAIGFHASEVTVDPQWVGLMVIELESLITTLSDISTVASGSALRSSDNTWVIDATAVTSAPLTVEPDVFRALALTPSVSFSSIRSSRPLIRGIDADDTGFSIDGHEVVNLYHIGRSFAGFPQIGAQQVTVTSQPARVNIGHTTSGLIEIRGRTWSPERDVFVPP